MLKFLLCITVLLISTYLLGYIKGFFFCFHFYNMKIAIIDFKFLKYMILTLLSVIKQFLRIAEPAFI